jgi:hypothetical protein
MSLAAYDGPTVSRSQIAFCDFGDGQADLAATGRPFDGCRLPRRSLAPISSMTA